MGRQNQHAQNERIEKNLQKKHTKRNGTKQLTRYRVQKNGLRMLRESSDTFKGIKNTVETIKHWSEMKIQYLK